MNRGVGADEVEPGQPAHRAAAAVAAHQVLRLVLLPARGDDDALVVLAHHGDRGIPDDLHTEDGSLLGQHGDDRVQARHETFHRRAGQPVGQDGGIDIGRVQRHAREVAQFPRIGRLDRLRFRADLLRIGAGHLHDRLEQAAPVERLGGSGVQAPQPQRKLLQRRVRVLVPLEDEDGTAGQGQLAGGEQPDRAGPPRR
ncbi:hypothetical protein GCM10020001_087490 [Nonomuraea salmonea]